MSSNIVKKVRNMYNIINILNRYNITVVISIEKINTGRTSNTWKVETEKGIFILRSLKDKKQGEVEFKITNHVNENHNGIVPPIISALSGLKYIEYDNLCFNLQPYVPGDLFDKNDVFNFKTLGKSIGMLHKSLQTISIIELPEDRFDMLLCWNQVKHKWSMLHEIDSNLFVHQDQMDYCIIQLYEETKEKNK